MGIVVMGLSHKTAPLDLRERLSIQPSQLDSSLERLSSMDSLREAVILSTCNRCEIYARPRKNHADAFHSLSEFFESLYPDVPLAPHLYRRETKDAVAHLFRVSAGLDSMVVGEAEILGQVKTAYLFAQSKGTTGKITNVLFQRALYVGKQVRTITGISEGASSVGSIAVQLAEKIFGSLKGHSILILGAGKMAEVTARHLLSQKAGEIVILNRTVGRAEELARALTGRAGSLDDLEKELLKADIVVCSTAVDKPFVTRAMVQQIMKSRRERSLYFIDISVPRNVEAAVHGLDNVYVYNIDDLQALVDENMALRRKAVQSAELIVNQLSEEFHGWITAALEGKTLALRHQVDL